MKTLNQFNFSGKQALIRVDFNVPLKKEGDNYIITDFTRINAAIPTIKKILNDGGSVVLMSHLGRPKGGYDFKFSLSPLVKELTNRIGVDVKFSPDCIGEEAFQLSSNLKAGEVLLLENLRFYKEETKGDEEFAKNLAKHGEVWVNDAFGTAHRGHASTAIVANYIKTKIGGYVIVAEMDNAKKILDNSVSPVLAIMGGAKISDKILIIERLLDKVDYLIIGGGMSYTFTKAKGGNIGTSLLEEDKLDFALNLIEKTKQLNVELFLPVDTVVTQSFDNDSPSLVVPAGEIPNDYMGLDIGPRTIENFANIIRKSKTLLWNGPMGVFEFPNFAKGTSAIAQAVVEVTKMGAFSLIGGGDSASAINNLGFGNDVSYVSTGGGALLEYMEGKKLPGIIALD